MIQLNSDTKTALISLWERDKVMLEGNILKVIDTEDDTTFSKYVEMAIRTDKDTKRKRLDIMKQVQIQNRELLKAETDNKKLMGELTDALKKSENAKMVAENDLDLLQKRTQFELIGSIVKVALWLIIGVGFITSLLYFSAMVMGKDTKILEATWSNMFGILLTNCFSIIGTIMGVKYASRQLN